jgi:Ca-activated chloride channel family protein
MAAVSLAHPWFLALSLVCLPELIFFATRARRFRNSLEVLSGPSARGQAGSYYALFSTIAAAAGLLFILCTSFALASPSWGRKGVVVERSGVETAFVIDVSRSMDAVESGSSRLESAKALVASLLRGVRRADMRSSFSIVAAKGEAVLLAPMTEDAAALESALEYAGPDVITTAGTDLERGIQAGIASFTESHAGDRILVLLSDGGELSGSALRTASALARARCRLVIVGVGGSEPVPVPGPDGAPLFDEAGRPVYSALDRSRLETIARAAGGRYLSFGDPGTPAAIAGEIEEAARGGAKIEYSTAERSGDFALAALAFLMIAIAAEALAVRRRLP